MPTMKMQAQISAAVYERVLGGGLLRCECVFQCYANDGACAFHVSTFKRVEDF